MSDPGTPGPQADSADRLARASLSLEGLSVGDAFGEQFFYRDGLSAETVRDVKLSRGPWRYTDDTAMALSILAELASHGRIDQASLASRFAAEFMRDPRRSYGPAAIGLLERIAAGENWRQVSRSLFRGRGSFGNGSAMRVAPLGAYFADDYGAAAEQARRSAEVTHTHPEGQAGAIAVAVAAAHAWRIGAGQAERDPHELLRTAARCAPDSEVRTGVLAAARIPFEDPPQQAAEVLGNGSKVSCQDTVPFCLWCAARELGYFQEAMWTTVAGLGDMDTNCAIVGGIVALTAGSRGIPRRWLSAREPLPCD